MVDSTTNLDDVIIIKGKQISIEKLGQFLRDNNRGESMKLSLDYFKEVMEEVFK